MIRYISILFIIINTFCYSSDKWIYEGRYVILENEQGENKIIFFYKEHILETSKWEHWVECCCKNWTESENIPDINDGD